MTTTAGMVTLCGNYGGAQADAAPGGTQHAPSPGMAVFDMNAGTLLGTVAATPAPTATSFTLTRAPGNATGVRLLVSAYGGCGPADYFGGALNTASGHPAARYWDNCIWGSRNITVTGNTFSMNAASVNGCTTANLCGDMTAIAFNAGVPKLMQFFDAYSNLIARASDGLGNVWSGNTYRWTGGGPGGWQFQAGLPGQPGHAGSVAGVALRPGRGQQLPLIQSASPGSAPGARDLLVDPGGGGRLRFPYPAAGPLDRGHAARLPCAVGQYGLQRRSQRDRAGHAGPAGAAPSRPRHRRRRRQSRAGPGQRSAGRGRAPQGTARRKTRAAR